MVADQVMRKPGSRHSYDTKYANGPRPVNFRWSTDT